MVSETFDYPDYLSAKKAVDDLSLNPAVWSEMASWLKHRQRAGRPLQILEIGAGIGTMIERLLDAGLLTDSVYTAIEMEASFRETAFARLAGWSRQNQYRLEGKAGNRRILSNGRSRLELGWLTGDILTIKDELILGQYDLLIGHAVIDLLPVPACLPELLNLVKPGGAYYFSLNFAGQTQFLPPHPLDPVISEAYHRDMDKRFPGLNWVPSKTGLNLGPWLISQGHKLVAEGPSDWRLVMGETPGRENRLFISNIIDTIDKALQGMPGLNEWLVQRRRQLDAGELGLTVTNRDCFGTTADNRA